MRTLFSILFVLMLAGCSQPFSLGKDTASVKLVLDPDMMRQAFRQTQLLDFSDDVTVEVSGPGITKKTIQASLRTNGIPTAIELGNIRLGNPRIVSIWPNVNRLNGVALRTAFNLTGNTTVNLNWKTTPAASVLWQLISLGRSDLATQIDLPALQAYIDKLKSNQNLVHYGLIDPEAIATATIRDGGISKLETLTPAPVLKPLWVKVTIKGLPEDTGVEITLDDPLSPRQSDLRNGTHLIGPIWPIPKSYRGDVDWKFTARVPGYLTREIPVAFTPSQTPEIPLDYTGWRLLTSSMPTPRCGMGTFVYNSALYYLGGMYFTSTSPSQAKLVDTIDCYSPMWNTFQSLANGDKPPGAKVAYAAIGAMNSDCFIFGGITGWSDSTPIISKTVQQMSFSGTAPHWEVAANMPRARAYAGAAVLNNKIYLVGGVNGNSQLAKEVDVYDPNGAATLDSEGIETNRWTLAKDLPTPREDIAVCALGNYLYAIGGSITTNKITIPQGAVERYDPSSNTWATLASLPTPRYGLTVVPIGSKIYAIGGVRQIPLHPEVQERCQIVEVYDTQTNTWSVAPPMNNVRAYHAVYPYNQTIFVLGGENGIPLPTVESYLVGGAL